MFVDMSTNVFIIYKKIKIDSPSFQYYFFYLFYHNIQLWIYLLQIILSIPYTHSKFFSILFFALYSFLFDQYSLFYKPHPDPHIRLTLTISVEIQLVAISILLMNLSFSIHNAFIWNLPMILIQFTTGLIHIRSN